MAENEVSNIIGAEPRELDLLPDVLYNKSSSFHVEQDRIRKLAESFVSSNRSNIHSQGRKENCEKRLLDNLKLRDVFYT